MKFKNFAFGGLLLLLTCVPATRAGQGAPPTAAQSGPPIEVYESSEDLHESLLQKAALYFQATQPPTLTIAVDESRRYQQIDGFGASLTDSSAWLLWHKLSERQRKETLEK